MAIEFEAIGIAVGGGISGSSLLILLLKLLERRVSRNEQAISEGTKRHYRDLQMVKDNLNQKIDDQEDCWEEEISKVHISVNNVNDNVQKVVTVMQMQAINSGHPELAEILKGGK